ncbi:hypothetical protein [Pseudothauera rhizosphaerae]|uniref:Uncharacterized protein n=1 Tax=Pseudothauera rhizosphaerae TaxID=2565932 RepID=A0A4S4AAI4_9RHOO|nr:hypothetical protein [Pseudothauera rhizosphaerae]THF55153.1 hypothetical protein E6O51_21165 [Pseudothauera rhizosphaerae]
MSTLSRELALRVGLAGRSLDITSRAMVAVLQEAVGLPFTREKFRLLDAGGLRRAAGALLLRRAEAELHEALEYLQGLRMADIVCGDDEDDFPVAPCQCGGRAEARAVAGRPAARLRLVHSRR